MSFIFGHKPSYTPPPTPPSPETTKIKAEEQEKKRIRKGLARNRTILTGALGLQDQPPIQTKTLLGV